MKNDKYYKANLMEKGDAEAIDAMRASSEKENKKKVLLRIDRRTHVMVNPDKATPEHAEELRQRYSENYNNPAKGWRR